MIIRFTRTITLPSGNLARNFRFNDRGYGRVKATYVYTDRRRNHQTARRFTVEFLNGKIDSIQARSANGGRVEYFKTSTITNELLEMLNEFNEAVHDVAKSYHEPAKVEEAETEQDSSSEDDTARDTDTDLMSTVRLVGMGVAVNLMVTLATLGLVWCNL